MTRPAIHLYENPRLSDAYLKALTTKLRGASFVVNDWGGFLSARGQYWQPTDGQDPFTTEAEAWDMFYNGLGRRVVFALGNTVAWEGEISGVRMTHKGVARVRTLDSVENAIRATYCRMTGNLALNGSGETAWNGAETYVVIAGTCTPQDVTWHSDGNCSWIINPYGSGVGYAGLGWYLGSLAAGDYRLRCAVYVPSAHSEPGLNSRVDADVYVGGASVLHQEIVPDLASGVFYIDVPFTIPAAGTGTLEITGTSFLYTSTWVFHIDGVLLWENGTRRSTSIYADTDSQQLFGARGVEWMLGATGDDEAIAFAQSRLAEFAWPRTEYEAEIATEAQAGKVPADECSIECVGYVDTLRGEFVTEGGLKHASDHITDLVGQSSLILPGVISPNTLDVFVEDIEAERLYDALQKATEAGDGTGALWTGGVYAGRRFDYYARDTSPRYLRKNRRWLHVNGTPVEPCLMRPGLVRDDDLPPAPYTGRDPRLQYIGEVEYDRDADAVKVRRLDAKQNEFATKPAFREATAAATITGSRIVY